MKYEKGIFDDIENKLKASNYKKSVDKDAFDIDKIVLHKIFGIFIFIFIFASTLIISFYSAQTIGLAIEIVISWIRNLSNSLIQNQNINFFINTYLLITTESILSCAAQIFSIYFFIYVLKETGYLARGVFIIDKIMTFIGLNKDAFIPIVSNFACNVPGILSTKTIKDKGVKLITIIISPLISCPAKLPIYILISGIYFTGIKQSLFVLLIYILGILLGIMISKILSLFINNSNSSFIIEIPSYKIPNIVEITLNSFAKATYFIKYTAPLIFLFTFVFWTLNNLYVKNDENVKESYLCRISKNIEPSLSILGFDYKMDIALLGGIFAKESVPIILKTLYNIDDNDSSNEMKTKIPFKRGVTFLIFTMLYCPCINTLIAIKNELGILISTFLVFFYFMLAFVTSFFVKNFINIFF